MTDASTASGLTGPDPSWRGLYTAGGLCAGLYVLLGVVIPMGQVMLEQYDFNMDAATFLEFISQRRTWWIVLQTLVLGSGVLAVVVFVALFVALKHVDKSRAALGATVAVVSQILFVAYYPVLLGLVYLSDRYATASDPARASLVAAAEALIAQNNAINRRFYAELFGWEYRIEHASECAWTGGEAAYPLILYNGQAHGGFVPGVGRNAVMADPMGAVIGVYAPAHDFPPPRGTFMWDALVTDDAVAASSYYGTVFGWGVERTEGKPSIFTRVDGSAAAGVAGSLGGSAGRSRWLTYFATVDVEATVKKALAGGAQLRLGPADAPLLGRCALLANPAGAQFGLIAARDGGMEVPDV